MSVTSSGRSSMSSTMRTTSGWLAVMAFAMACRSIVLPVRGAATMRAALALAERGDEVHDPGRECSRPRSRA